MEGGRIDIMPVHRSSSFPSSLRDTIEGAIRSGILNRYWQRPDLPEVNAIVGGSCLPCVSFANVAAAASPSWSTAST